MPEKTPYPIVLAHGIAWFDVFTDSFISRFNAFMWDLNFEFDRLHYFKGVASYLSKRGFDVHKTSVGFADTVEIRAAQLAEQIREILAQTLQEKVHIIGHSMGGLDARQMLLQEREMADKVASVTSIGTPHNGTSFADVYLAGGGNAVIEALKPYISFEGFQTLTLAERQAFNEQAQDWEAKNSVFYQVYAAVQEKSRLFIPLKGSWEIISAYEGENDGLVSASSQLWTAQLTAVDGTTKSVVQHRFPFPLDHFNETGRWDLQELSGTRWWRMNLRREKKTFETAVKEAYLHIAREITTAVPAD